MAAMELWKHSSDLPSSACLSFFYPVESYLQVGNGGTHVAKHADPAEWEHWAVVELATTSAIYQARA